MSELSNTIKFSLKTPDNSNRKIGCFDGLAGTFADYVSFYDSIQKIIIFKNRKIDVAFEGDWNGFSFHFGDFARFVGLVTKKIKFIKTGLGCSGNIGNNCVVELGKSNNISVLSGNYVKFCSSSIIDAKDFNVITADTDDSKGLAVLKSQLTVGSSNKIHIKHSIGDLSFLNDNDIVNETGSKLDCVLKSNGIGNYLIDGGLTEAIGEENSTTSGVSTDFPEVRVLADFLDKNLLSGAKINIHPLQGLGAPSNLLDYDLDEGVDHEDPYFSEIEINKVKKHLRKKMIGQDEILSKMDDFLDGINLKTKKGPAGVFFQIGKTGTGKNYLWESFTEIADIPLKIIDASTFHESEGSSLLGTTQGYVGSSEPSILETFYAESLQYGGRCVVIIDELDKITVGKSGNKRDAIVAFVQTLMNILESDTLLLKNSGEEIDISKFIFVMNTNMFVDEVIKNPASKIGFLSDIDVDSTVEKATLPTIKEKLKEFFPLSVYNRLSSNIFFFNEMASEVVDSIIKKELKIIVDKIKEYYGTDVKLPTFSKVRSKILENYDKDMGMRGIKNYVHDHIKADFIKIAKNTRNPNK